MIEIGTVSDVVKVGEREIISIALRGPIDSLRLNLDDEILFEDDLKRFRIKGLKLWAKRRVIDLILDDFVGSSAKGKLVHQVRCL